VREMGGGVMRNPASVTGHSRSLILTIIHFHNFLIFFIMPPPIVVWPEAFMFSGFSLSVRAKQRHEKYWTRMFTKLSALVHFGTSLKFWVKKS